MIVPNAGDILRNFYAAVIKRDIAEARRYLNDDLLFLGLFETYRDAAIFFELETKAPVAATTLVAEWHQTKNGKISHVESAFDGRPFAAMFAGGKR